MNFPAACSPRLHRRRYRFGKRMAALQRLEHRTLLSDVAPDAGAASDVRVFEATGTLDWGFYAFGTSFNGGVRLGAGDVTGDGRPDLVIGTGPNVAPHVRVFDVPTQTLKRDLLPYADLYNNNMNPPAGYHGGVSVTAVDITGDSKAELVISPEAGGAAEVRVYDGATTSPGASPIRRFLAYDAYPGGVGVATADVNGDGRPDVVTAPLTSAGPDVRAFDLLSTALIDQFWAFNPNSTGNYRVAAASPPAAPSSAGNHAPVARDDYFTAKSGVTLNAWLMANDTDIDGQPLAVAAVPWATTLQSVQQRQGLISRSWTALSVPRLEQVQYQVTDGWATAAATAYIYVTPDVPRYQWSTLTAGSAVTQSWQTTGSQVVLNVPPGGRWSTQEQFNGGVLEQPSVGLLWFDSSTGQFIYYPPEGRGDDADHRHGPGVDCRYQRQRDPHRNHAQPHAPRRRGLVFRAATAERRQRRARPHHRPGHRQRQHRHHRPHRRRGRGGTLGSGQVRRP